MSTHSRIGMVLEDGQVRSVYCHWDGYPSNNGVILLENYTDAEKVKKLIDLGSISSLRENVDIPEGKVHNFDSPLDDVVIAYHRDRGEDLEIRTNKDVDDFRLDDNDAWTYLFKDGKWLVTENYSRYDENGKYLGESDKVLVPLTDEYIATHE